MENVTVRESARLRARHTELGTAHPQSSTQPGSDPAATTTPPTVQPGSALADGLPGTPSTSPSHYVASPPCPTEACPTELNHRLKPTVTDGRLESGDDVSEQYLVRISMNTLAELGALAAEFPATLDPAAKSQLERCQEALRRFGQTRITRPDVASPNADLQTELAKLRTKYNRESNLHTRFRKQFDEEIEIRGELQLQLEDAKTSAVAEAMRANRNEGLLDDMRVVMTRLATQPATAMPPAATPHTPKSKPTRPDPYTGGRADLCRFKTQLSLAMAATNYFADEQHRLRYCFELLKGDALATMEPYLNPTGHIALTSTSAFLDELSRVFGDSDEKATAARELEQLRQGKRDFAYYYADFVRLMNILGYGDDAHRYALDRGLSIELLAGLEHQPVPPGETLAEYEQRIRTLDDTIRRYRGIKSTMTPRPFAPRSSHNPPTGRATTGNTPVGHVPTTSDHHPRVTSEERARCLEAGLCFYCSNGGHQARHCPNHPAA